MRNRRQFIQIATAGVAGAGLIESAHAAGPHYVIPPKPVPSLPVDGSHLHFPVHRIYCMGLNYAAHVKEGKDVLDVPPFYFQKSNDMIVENGASIRYPLLTKNFHHEIELVVALAHGGSNIPLEKALDCVFGYAVGLDMTRRDLQMEALNKKMPWEPGKSFEQCAPCTAIYPAAKVGHLNKGRIQLKVNDQVRQDADLSDMILDVPHVIALLSTGLELAPGDIIYMGTPAGVGPVVPGDRMVGTIEKLGTLAITVA